MVELKRALLVLVMIVSVLFVAPVDAAAQQEQVSCQRGVLVQGRCLSVDGRAEICDDEGACVAFVAESFADCPAPSVLTIDDTCEIRTAAPQLAPSCPDGARGEVDACFIYVAKGPAGCPPPSFEDDGGSCVRLVANAAGPFFCELDAQQLQGLECVEIVDKEPSPCPAGTVRMDSACWSIPPTLTPPVACAGHGEALTLDSGRCRATVAIPTGPTTCEDGAGYLDGIVSGLVDDTGFVVPGSEVPAVGCVDLTVEGASVFVNCVFPGDDRDWIQLAEDDDCSLIVLPDQISCPADTSFDDSLGGVCARFEPAPADLVCPDGSTRNGLNCVFVVDFETFACPGGTEVFSTVFCRFTQTYQGSFECVGVWELVDEGESQVFRCRPPLGPQPDQCNATGTVEDCYEIREPVAVECGTETGCVAPGDFSLPGDVDCDGLVRVIDALVIAQFAAEVRTVADRCETTTPGTEIYAGDGDMNGDDNVNIVDALLVAQCVVGADVDAACNAPDDLDAD